MYIDKLDDIVNEYNNAYHRTMKRKPTDVKDSAYINIDKEVNYNDPKFKVGDHVRVSKYKNIFAKGYTPNWSEEIFVIKEFKNIDQQIDHQEFRIEKAIRKKGDKLYVKSKGYDNSFNSWIDKNESVFS